MLPVTAPPVLSTLMGVASPPWGSTPGALGEPHLHRLSSVGTAFTASQPAAAAPLLSGPSCIWPKAQHLFGCAPLLLPQLLTLGVPRWSPPRP